MGCGMPHHNGRAIAAPLLSYGVRHRRLQANAQAIFGQNISAVPCSEHERVSDTVSNARHGRRGISAGARELSSIPPIILENKLPRQLDCAERLKQQLLYCSSNQCRSAVEEPS